jgi:uncharacterized protein with HEPN domain
MSQPDDMMLLRDILGNARLARDSARRRSRADLDSDRFFLVSCKRLVEMIGEAATGVSDEFKDAHADLPWRQIIGTYNVLVHGYAQLDLDILWDIIDVNLAELIEKLEQEIGK